VSGTNSSAAKTCSGGAKTCFGSSVGFPIATKNALISAGDSAGSRETFSLTALIIAQPSFQLGNKRVFLSNAPLIIGNAGVPAETTTDVKGERSLS
jgi:hypothetical protein